MPPPADAPDAMALLQPLTAKPVLFVANVEEGSDEVPPEIAEHARAHGAAAVAVSARLESELAELDDDEAAAMRADLGLERVRPRPRRARRVRAAASWSPSSPPARTSPRSPGTCATACRCGTPPA